MSADEYLGIDMWSRSTLHALDYIHGNVTDALGNLNELFVEHQACAVRDALVEALAQIEIYAQEIRDTAVAEDVEHQHRELGVE